uniref:Uncharacterized protein n=1 Tax=Candidatus Kentrum sp. TC TaxID=2126339 RepID=A0A450ZUQ3_9GAMM|nr:MAG: hypothetical protein BECKTC1821F_GA0114240_101818 [Candidatus Kentron sp. TC]
MAAVSMRSEHADIHRGQKLDVASSVKAGYTFALLPLSLRELFPCIAARTVYYFSDT